MSELTRPSAQWPHQWMKTMGDVDLLVQKAKARFAHEGLQRVYDGYDGQMVRWSPSWPQDVVQSVAVMTSIRVTILGQNGTNFTQQMPYCSSKTDICRWAARILTGRRLGSGDQDMLVMFDYRVSSKTVYTWFLPFFSSKSNPILTSRVSFEN